MSLFAQSGPTVSTSCYQGSSASTLTLGPIDTTGANAIAVAVASFNVITSLTDNMSNGNATGLTAASGGSPNNQLFYWLSPNGGSGHTITINGSSGLYASACVYVMSGVTGTYSNVQSVNSAGYGSSTCQAGSITPPSSPQVIIAGFGVYSPSGTPTIDSSYTLGAYQAGTAGSAYGEATGYLIQSAGAATNPQWNWGNSATTPSCVIAAFGGAPVTPTVATPTISPSGGYFANSQTVTITDATAGSTIYYTTDGTTPTTSSNVYSSAVTIANSGPLQAIAVHAGYNNSSVASAAFTITSILPTPTFSLSPGSYSGSPTVSISDAGPSGTTIYYTTNGSTPTASSNTYSSPITLAASQTLKAIAVKAGFINSSIAGAIYKIANTGPSVATACYQGSSASTMTLGPIDTTGAKAIAIAVASMNGVSSVTDNQGNGNATGLTAASGGNPGNQIFYWETPTVSTSHSFTVNGGAALYGSACVYVMSGVAGTYSGSQSAHSENFRSSSCQAGSITPGSGPQVIIAGFAVHNPTGAPTIDSSYSVGAYKSGTSAGVYGEAAAYLIQSTSATTNPQWNWSNDAQSPSCVVAAFGGSLPTAATPTFSPAAGVYGGAPSVTISSTTPSTIYYTTDGSTPSTSSNVYSTPVPVSATETIKAIAVATGFSDSDVAPATYEIAGAGGYPVGDTFGATDYLTSCCGNTGWANTTAPSQGYIALMSSNGEVFPISLGGQGLASFNGVAFKNDHYTQVKVWKADTTDAGTTGPCVRMDTHGTGVCYRVNSGSITALVNGVADHVVATGCPVAGDGDTVRLEAADSNYTCSNITTGGFVTATDTGSFIGTPAILVDQRSSGGSTLGQFQADCSPSCGTSAFPLIMPVYPSVLHGAVEQVVLSLPVACASTCGGGNVYLDGALVYPTGIYSNGSITLSLANSGQNIGQHEVHWVSGGGPLGTATSESRYFTASATPALTATPTVSVAPGSITVGQDVTGTENPNYTDTLGGGYATLDDVLVPSSGFSYAFFYGTASITRDLGSSLSIGPHRFTTYYSGTSSYAPSSGSASFVVTGPTPTPAFSLSSGLYSTTQTVSITDTLSSANIYYTTNGDAPTTSSTPYTGAITVSATETIKAIAASPDTGYTASTVNSAAYTIAQKTPTPTFSPAAGTYGATQSVTIGDSVPVSYTIYYTTNGSTPTTSSPVYTGPITVSAASETLQAIAVASDPAYTASQVASAAYSISQATAPPTFSPPAGTYNYAQSVTIQEANPAAHVYYTTNGSTPTTSSPVYTTPIPVTASVMLRAIAAAANETPTPDASASYAFVSVPLYSYCIFDTADCSPSSITGATSGYAANGNITAYNDSVNGHWSNINYDGLNRLISGTQTPVAAATQSFCWSYDSFGNRTSQASATQPFSTGSGECSTRASGTLLDNIWAHYGDNNQLTQSALSTAITCPPNSTTASGNGYCYDAAGNLVADGVNQTLYDAEGRICAVMNSGVMTQYIYDAEGNRVAKGTITSFSCDMTPNSSGVPANGFVHTNTYIIGPNGEQMTEFQQNGTTSTWLHTNVYAGGQLAATYSNDTGSATATPLTANLHFTLSDWLGSKRVQLAANGSVESSWANLPFGDRQQCVICANDATEQHFTGKERDTESGLDYFGARYMASSMGRFMSPDPANESVDLLHPQTWNRYLYALNNPLSIVDRNGMWPYYIHEEIFDQALSKIGDFNLMVVKSASYNMDFDKGQQDPVNAPEHGMSNGPASQDPLEAQAQGDEFIAKESAAAQKEQAQWIADGHKGYSPAALTHFGNAAHTVQDRLSPSHAPNKPWSNRPFWSKSTRDHVKGELSITEQQRNAASKATLDLFIRLLGAPQADNSSVTVTERYQLPCTERAKDNTCR